MNKPFRIISADHTGITVENLERSLAFWRDVLGFELSHTAHQTGELAREITGVAGAEIKLAVLKAPGGHKIELLEYLTPPDRKHADVCPCDVGHVHVALLVDDLDAIREKIAGSGWKAAEANDVGRVTGRDGADMMAHSHGVGGGRVGGIHRNHVVNCRIANVIDDVLGVATMRGCDRVRTKDDFESGSPDSAADDIAVERQDALHRREAFFGVARRAQEAFLVN